MIWTRSANSHTGQRQTIAAPKAGQMASASDYARSGTIPKSPCAEGGVHRWNPVIYRRRVVLNLRFMACTHQCSHPKAAKRFSRPNLFVGVYMDSE